MRLNLSEKWYAREFRKDAEEPAISVAIGRADVQIPPIEESVLQEDNERVHKTDQHPTPLPPSNAS